MHELDVFCISARKTVADVQPDPLAQRRGRPRASARTSPLEQLAVADFEGSAELREGL
jgi:hypothetical protein